MAWTSETVSDKDQYFKAFETKTTFESQNESAELSCNQSNEIINKFNMAMLHRCRDHLETWMPSQ